MGRYTTVQAYADNNPNMRSVSYEQAVGTKPGSSIAAGKESEKVGVVRPEKVDNPYGSTAGSGSGEFHVYRHARSRELARLKALDEEEVEQQRNIEFEKKVNEWKTEEEMRTEKRRRKRMREKEAKLRKKNMKLGGVFKSLEDTKENVMDKEEFQYTPIHQSRTAQAKDSLSRDEEVVKNEVQKNNTFEQKGTDKASKDISTRFANDGSFLEKMKLLVEEEKKH